MKRYQVRKGMATTLIAFALLMGITVPVKAIGMEETEITKIGLQFAPSLALDNVVQTGEVVEKWTIKTTPVPAGCHLLINVYEGSRENSETGSWEKDEAGKAYFDSYKRISAGNDEIVLNNYEFTMGTKTVEAYLFDRPAYEAALKTYRRTPAAKRPIYPPSRADYMVNATNAISINVSKIPVIETAVTSTSVQISMKEDSVTGYEIYRKYGKSYKKIAKVAKNVYKDSGLASKTKLTYKVRPYYYDRKLNKTKYGKYAQFDVTTSGSALKLKANLSGKNDVKLSWTKVSGAEKYQIYRKVTTSSATVYSSGYGNEYSTYQLIKTLKKSAKSYTDKSTSSNQNYSYIVRAVLSGNKQVEEGSWVSLKFQAPSIVAQYTNSSGTKYVEWKKVYGADGYIIEKYMQDPLTGRYGYREFKRVGKTTTKTSFIPPVPSKNQYGSWNTQDNYRIRAYKNKDHIVSAVDEIINVNAVLPIVTSVSAKKVSNGIQVSWTPVNGASYYKVYRVKAGALLKNSNGCYLHGQGTQVSEYVGVQAPVRVDPVAWNNERAAYKADNTGRLPKPAYLNRVLDLNKVYYYKNFQYKQSKFTGTSMIDYVGEIYGSRNNVDYLDERTSGYQENQGRYTTPIVEFNPERNYRVGPQEGITYQYYVIAVMAEEKMQSNIVAAIPGTTTASVVGTKPIWKQEIIHSLGCKKIGSATYTSISAPKKTSIKSIKAGKKSATITFKKVSGASNYRIYRSTKSKGPYQYVATTTKTSYKNKGLSSGKKYYYKVVVIKENEAKAYVKSSSSKAKSVRVK